MSLNPLVVSQYLNDMCAYFSHKKQLRKQEKRITKEVKPTFRLGVGGRK